MSVVDLLLSDVAARAQRSATTPAEFSDDLKDEAMHSYLVGRVRSLPEANAIPYSPNWRQALLWRAF